MLCLLFFFKRLDWKSFTIGVLAPKKTVLFAISRKQVIEGFGGGWKPNHRLSFASAGGRIRIL
jgi:hypothetical protein